MNKPTRGFLDLDMMLFEAASFGEKVQYSYYDGIIPVAVFDSAAEGKRWLEEFEVFGCDPEFGYDGDPTTLKRETTYKDLGVDKALKGWDEQLDKWIKMVEAFGITNVTGFVSKGSGNANFRHELATIHEYKKGRDNAHKPIHLEAVRKYARKNPIIKSPKGNIEVDDIVTGFAQYYGEDGMVVASDKDCMGSQGCWIFCVGRMTEPVWSDPTKVGHIEPYNKEAIGWGWLYWLYQTLCGDQADTYKGCQGYGSKTALKLLQEYNDASIDRLPEVLAAVGKVFKKKYGEEYNYNHWKTDELIEGSWYDVMNENLALAYMKNNEKDSHMTIMKHLNKEDV